MGCQLVHFCSHTHHFCLIYYSNGGLHACNFISLPPTGNFPHLLNLLLNMPAHYFPGSRMATTILSKR